MDIFKRIDEGTLFGNLVHRTRNLDPSSFPGRARYIVSDLAIPVAVREKIGPVIRSLDGLSSEEIANSVFYVYFLCDSDALPVIKRIKSHGGTFVPHLDFSKTEYRFVNRLVYNALAKTWAKADRVSHLVPVIHENICEALELALQVEGDYVEIGVYLGGSALTALHFMDELHAAASATPKRKAWLIDTFDGFAYDEAETSSDTIWAGTHKLYGLDSTMAYIAETLSGVPVTHTLVAANICSDPLPTEIEKIAVANIDVDMYEPTVAALTKVAPLVQPGGIIIAEDPTSTPGLYGALLAMDEFLSSDMGCRFQKVFKGGQYFLIRKS